jgi:hypothetical protein
MAQKIYQQRSRYKHSGVLLSIILDRGGRTEKSMGDEALVSNRNYSVIRPFMAGHD